MNRKKVLAFLLSTTCAFSMAPFTAWADEAETEAVETEAAETEAAEAEDADSAEIMTYEEYLAADLGSEVVIETYVQATQTWADGITTIYAQDEEGAYLIDQMECAYSAYTTLTQGVKIKVTGIKSGPEAEAASAEDTDAEDAGAEDAETEAAEEDAAAEDASEEAATVTAIRITDATVEVEEGSYIAEALDVTNLLGTDELAEHQNEYVSFSGMTVVAFDDGQVFHYGKDGSGEDGDDLYFNASYNGETCTFRVAVGLCGVSSEPYVFTTILSEGYVLDITGFLCWDEDGVAPHIADMDFN